VGLLDHTTLEREAIPPGPALWNVTLIPLGRFAPK